MQTLYSNFIGIDIGKSEFVSFLKNDDKTNTYKNNLKGFKSFEYSKFKQVFSLSPCINAAQMGSDGKEIGALGAKNLYIAP